MSARIYSPSVAREALRRVAMERRRDSDPEMATALARLADSSLANPEEVIAAVERIGGRARAEALRLEVWL